MKGPDVFYVPNSLMVQKQENKDGPSPVWVVWRPNTSMCVADREAVLRFARWPKSTPTGQELRQWLYADDQEAALAEPNDETRMVT